MAAVPPEKLGAPAQESMESGIDMIEKHFAPHEDMIVKQTMRGCCQECMGCEAKSEFKVGPFDYQAHMHGHTVDQAAMAAPDTLYALEKSSFCCRCCWRDGRPFNMEVSEGSEQGGRGVVNYRKPCGMPLNFEIPTENGSISCPCCCFLPTVTTELPDGTPLGSESAYKCDACLYVPKFKYSEDGTPVYILKPETCCGGCCIACNPCSGKGCVWLPFYFHDPETMAVMGGYTSEAPQIRKVWAGFKKECCSTADTFVVKYPSGIDAKRKAGLLGMTFLIDFTWFERQKDTGDA